MKGTILSLAVFALLLTACSETNRTDNKTNNPDTAVLKSNDAPAPAPGAQDAWASIDWNSPIVKYDEVDNDDISIRGNEKYSVYGLGENILFETGKADLKAGAEDKLRKVAASINKRYADGKVKVYGYTDATGAAGDNMDLSKERAAAVKSWLVTNGNIAEDRITLYAAGESNPAATNDNASGREQNRRVEIAAMK